MEQDLQIRLSEILKHSLLSGDEVKILFEFYNKQSPEDLKKTIDRYEEDRKSSCGLKMNINKLIILACKLKKNLPVICTCFKK